MQTLFTAGNLDTSVEVAIFSYSEDSTSDHRKTDNIEYLANTLLGSLILPADSNAGVVEMFYKEVAQALSQNSSDLNINNNSPGGVTLLLSHEEIKSQLRTLLNPNDNESSGWKTDYWMYDGYTYNDHCVVTSANDGKYYRFDFEIQDETTVVLVGEPREQIKEFRDVVETEVAEADEIYLKYKEQLDKYNEVSTSLSKKETELNEINEQNKIDLEKLQNEIAEFQKVKTETEVKDEALLNLNEQINSLKEEIASFAPIKTEYESIQNQKRIEEENAKKEEMKQFALSSKLITEQEINENEEIKNAIQELNQQKIKDIILDRVISKASVETSTKNGDVTIVINEQEDLLPETIETKYEL
jgi:DNA repair exonuclease SbcCD ATPase subunit